MARGIPASGEVGATEVVPAALPAERDALRPLRLRRRIGGRNDGPSGSSAPSSNAGAWPPGATARKGGVS